ncbi:hypothetical protein [Komagataeibacter europaeus]|uniref:hypothetical protein n=1 Tax=Komagataeibacter europaeus TaxID=33995 RepID=UPI00031EF70D|nr:hypothetical protein [Komagataeibacter europaeus]
MTGATALRHMVLAALLGLCACDDALMARRTPPPTDCARRGGTWQVNDDRHAGLCRAAIKPSSCALIFPN